MIKQIIKHDANYSISRDKLVVGGTNVQHFGDILADALLLIPKKTKYGYVSWSVYQQAEAIYEQTGAKLMSLPNIKLKGHSLGGAVSLLLALIMLDNGYEGNITVKAWGSPKVLSTEARVHLSYLVNKTTWRVRHRDIVPFLGWWKEPKHKTAREGLERRNIFDWSFEEHEMY